MKRIIISTAAIILLLCCSVFAFAHSGRTDDAGGHYDRSTGEYHYHHGYSAHQHINGYCPYRDDHRTYYFGDSNELFKPLVIPEFVKQDYSYDKEEDLKKNSPIFVISGVSAFTAAVWLIGYVRSEL